MAHVDSDDLCPPLSPTLAASVFQDVPQNAPVEFVLEPASDASTEPTAPIRKRKSKLRVQSSSENVSRLSKSSQVEIGITCKDCHHCHEYKRLLAESLPQDPKLEEDEVLESKPKKPAHPKALNILKLWRDVCKEVSGKPGVVQKNTPTHTEARRLFNERYTSVQKPE